MPIRTALRGARTHLTAATLGLAVAGCLGASAPAQAAAGAAALGPQERAACQQINAFRASRGLAPLKVSVTLTKAARWMSTDMAANDSLDHIDSRGRDSSRRIRSFGFSGTVMGENIAAGNAGAAATVEQWKTAAGHRRTMLRADYKVIGLGRTSGAGTTFEWYWTTTFGTGRERAVAC